MKDHHNTPWSRLIAQQIAFWVLLAVFYLALCGGSILLFIRLVNGSGLK
jgi:hypothetical protein